MKTRSLIENYQSFHLSSKKTFSTISSNSIIEKRGRQLTLRKNLAKNKEYNVNITNSKNSTCESKYNHLNHNNIKIHRKIFKRNKINSNSKSDNSKFSDSDSFSSNDMRKKVFYEEESFNYPTKVDVGLISSDEESIEIDPQLKFNFENEIESILIEIYNKNFPSNDKISKRKNHLLKRDKYRYLKKNNIELNKNELKITFGQLNERYNYFVLQILSKKIKELIYKYKEKLFENEELSKINQEFKKKKEEIINTTDKFFQEICNQTDRKNLKENNRMFSPTASTSSNISDSYMLNQFNLDKTYFNSIFLQIIKNINSNLGNTIFRELDNIKTSLRNSSIEIKQIFQYPLKLLKNNFSIECIQLEAFNKILIKDDLISTILIQTKEYLIKKNLNSYLELINSLVNDKKYDRKEMTWFDKLLSQILKNKFKNINIIDNSLNENCKECFIDNNNIESDNENINENIYIKKNILSSSFCSIDSHVNINNNNNNNSINNKVNTEIVNNEEENRLVDLDIDDLVKLIDSDENNNHKKKKKKKNKKNKNKNICGNKLNNDHENLIIENKNVVKNFSEEIDNKEFENIYNEFKININKNSLNNNEKIKPKLSAKWLMELYTNGL